MTAITRRQALTSLAAVGAIAALPAITAAALPQATTVSSELKQVRYLDFRTCVINDRYYLAMLFNPYENKPVEIEIPGQPLSMQVGTGRLMSRTWESELHRNGKDDYGYYVHEGKHCDWMAPCSLLSLDITEVQQACRTVVDVRDTFSIRQEWMEQWQKEVAARHGIQIVWDYFGHVLVRNAPLGRQTLKVIGA